MYSAGSLQHTFSHSETLHSWSPQKLLHACLCTTSSSQKCPRGKVTLENRKLKWIISVFHLLWGEKRTSHRQPGIRDKAEIRARML